jgi:hypothetical protein
MAQNLTKLDLGRRRSHFKCSTDPSQQKVMIEGFREEFECTFSDRANSHSGISTSCDEDDRNIAFLFFQPGLQLQTRHLRHTDINKQARSSSMQIGFEEFLRGAKASRDQSSRIQQVAQRILHRLVVIDDCYQFGRSVH